MLHLRRMVSPMGKELKFRVWDKELRVWVGEHQLILTLEGTLAFRHGGRPLQDRFVIQQFTGLKDSKNQEIYEGDIVEAISDCGNNIRVVEYGELCCYLPNRNYAGGDYAYTIIGNIFDNPELVKE